MTKEELKTAGENLQGEILSALYPFERDFYSAERQYFLSPTEENRVMLDDCIERRRAAYEKYTQIFYERVKQLKDENA